MSWTLSCPVGASLAVWVIVGTEIERMQMRCDGRHLPGWHSRVHTSGDYCTINHPCVNASAFIIRTPIRHPNLCSPSHKPWTGKENTGERRLRQQYTQWLTEKARSDGSRKKMFCQVCFSGSGSLSILGHPWGAQICSIKLGLLRGQSDCSNTWKVYSIRIKLLPVQNPRRSCSISGVKSLLIFVLSEHKAICARGRRMWLHVLWECTAKSMYSSRSLLILLSNYIFSFHLAVSLSYIISHFIFFLHEA